jgi:cardiolipin synthase
MHDALKSAAIIAAVLERLIAVWASFHAVLHKRETQTVIGWVGLIWLSPFVGSLLYYCLGINRIQRKGQRMQRGMVRKFREALRRERLIEDPESLLDLPFGGRLQSVVAHVTGKLLLRGNSVQPLCGGECAYPAMLDAIARARISVTLCSYIFDNDRAGAEFVSGLIAAHQRGVQVRVLIDDVGSRYTRPPITRLLHEAGIPVATFLPTWAPRLASYANLRIHRKLMVVDGETAFAGGMNIREGCRGDWKTKHPIQDIHFRILGPVVSQVQETFVTDWAFATNEQLQGERWFGLPKRCGDVLARGIPDGPDSDLDNIRLTILAALSVAEKKVDIVTPYFLPDESVINALNVSAMRGVRIRIVIPRVNNIAMVGWASSDPLRHVLERGCEVYRTPPPFDHSKIMLVDDEWTLIGSSNWDPRSLRLNFEFNVECYDRELNRQLSGVIDQKINVADRLTLGDLNARPWAVRIRDGIARLAIPYL